MIRSNTGRCLVLWTPGVLSLTLATASIARGPRAVHRALDALHRQWLADCEACGRLLGAGSMVAVSLDPEALRPEAGDHAVSRFFLARYGLAPARSFLREELAPGDFRHELVLSTDAERSQRRAAAAGAEVLWQNGHGLALLRHLR